MTTVLNSGQAGQRGNAGLQVRAHFFKNEQKQLCLGIELTNMTGQPLAQDFDLKFNKNAFAVSVAGATNALAMPAPGQASSAQIPCAINKANLDGKNPPKNPFMVHVAMKTALDVFYFEVPCMLHCLINSAKQVTQ